MKHITVTQAIAVTGVFALAIVGVVLVSTGSERDEPMYDLDESSQFAINVQRVIELHFSQTGELPETNRQVEQYEDDLWFGISRKSVKKYEWQFQEHARSESGLIDGLLIITLDWGKDASTHTYEFECQLKPPRTGWQVTFTAHGDNLELLNDEYVVACASAQVISKQFARTGKLPAKWEDVDWDATELGKAVRKQMPEQTLILGGNELKNDAEYFTISGDESGSRYSFPKGGKESGLDPVVQS